MNTNAINLPNVRSKGRAQGFSKILVKCSYARSEDVAHNEHLKREANAMHSLKILENKTMQLKLGKI